MKDYYKTLGVSKTASVDEIKKAFRVLAHTHHPDKGGDEKKFKEASEAYQILSDQKKREEYDTYGSVGGGQSGYSGAQQGGGFQGGFSSQGFDGVDLNDIFGDIFGGGGGRQQKRGRDISVDLQLLFSEGVFGVDRKIRVNKVSRCSTCNGNGAKPGTTIKTCPHCKGQGQIKENIRSFFGTISQVRECSTCSGTGKIPDEKCTVCKGHGVARREEELDIHVPGGIQNGETLRMTGAGEAIQNATAGDLYIKVHVAPHAVFQRSGHNITMNLKVKLTDAILGAEYPVDTLDGKITLKIPKGVSSGEILRVREKGIPMGQKHRGDFLITLEIKTPTKLSSKATKLIEDLRGEGV